MVKQSQSYKQFVNNHGVTVYERTATFITEHLKKSDIAKAVKLQEAVRVMEEVMIISKDEADVLVQMIVERTFEGFR